MGALPQCQAEGAQSPPLEQSFSLVPGMSPWASPGNLGAALGPHCPLPHVKGRLCQVLMSPHCAEARKLIFLVPRLTGAKVRSRGLSAGQSPTRTLRQDAELDVQKAFETEGHKNKSPASLI